MAAGFRTFLGLLLFLFLLGGCRNSAFSFEEKKTVENQVKAKKSSLSFASWNTQTFFDAQKEGCEYDDFKKAGNWSRDKYLVRLARLCEVMTSLNPDVFVLQEIENQAVLQDIANQLSGKSWSKKRRWNYALFTKEEGAAIGSAVFSRFPIYEISSHSMDIRCQGASQPSCRPILQFSIEVEENKRLWVLVNHWKSKLGNDESKIWRQWQESMLSGRLLPLLSENQNIILSGDFNQDAKEFYCDFKRNNKENTAFRNASFSGKKNCWANSPWFNQSGNFTCQLGSYFYQGQWERIDNIFTAGEVKAAAFAPRAEEPWADSEGHPIAYKIYSGEGYSDHLPLMCTISF
ncbi:MAG: endonuclease/exonuclease/phosphatase family protein [Treponema sp.]|nr:endonuclease/exonuclease/phosphatase family protein [Treponema sp.]